VPAGGLGEAELREAARDGAGEDVVHQKGVAVEPRDARHRGLRPQEGGGSDDWRF
jgi:hypothetical protein